MKKFFLFAVALVGTMLAHAQDSDTRSATLQSGETTTVFSGADAFKNALEAAEDGSILAPLMVLVYLSSLLRCMERDSRMTKRQA